MRERRWKKILAAPFCSTRPVFFSETVFFCIENLSCLRVTLLVRHDDFSLFAGSTGGWTNRRAHLFRLRASSAHLLSHLLSIDYFSLRFDSPWSLSRYLRIAFDQWCLIQWITCRVVLCLPFMRYLSFRCWFFRRPLTR